MAYLSRTVRVDLSDLVDDPEGSFVELRSPAMLSTDELGRLGLLTSIPDNASDQAKVTFGQQRLAKLVTSWRVFDAETDELLGEPTPEALGRVPSVVTERVANALSAVGAPKS
jgi:hypothetical protein